MKKSLVNVLNILGCILFFICLILYLCSCVILNSYFSDIYLKRLLLVLVPSLLFIMYILGITIIFKSYQVKSEKFKVTFIVLICFIFFMNGFHTVTIYKEYDGSLFTQEKWECEPNSRVYIVNNMTKVLSLDKLNKQQVLGVLGKPDTKFPSGLISPDVIMGIKGNTEKDEYITYLLGPRQGVYEEYFIRIYFNKDGRVKGYITGQFVT